MILLGIVASAAALRFIVLDERNLWLDEAASWWTTRFDISGVLSRAREDIHPPLYYLLLKGWTAVFGDSLTAMRSLSALFGTVTVALGVVLARRFLPSGAAVLAGIWLAVSPHLVYFAQEMRMYAALSAVSLGMLLAYLRWIESGHRRRAPLVVLALLSAAAMYLHYFAAVFIAALWLHFVWLTLSRAKAMGSRDLRRAWQAWLLTFAAAALLYLPWMETAWIHVTRGQTWRQDQTMAQAAVEMLIALRHFLQAYTYSNTFFLWTASVLLHAVVVAGLALLTHDALRRGPSSASALLLTVVGVPAALGWIGLITRGHMDLSRYLPFASPLIILATAAGWSRLRLRTSHVGLAIAIACSVPWLVNYYRTTSRDSDVRPIVAHVQALPAPQPPLLIAPEFMQICLDYYLRTAAPLPMEGIRVGEDLGARLQALRARTSTAFAIIDYRWPNGAAIARAAGYVEVPMAPSTNGIKLFRYGSAEPGK